MFFAAVVKVSEDKYASLLSTNSDHEFIKVWYFMSSKTAFILNEWVPPECGLTCYNPLFTHFIIFVRW